MPGKRSLKPSVSRVKPVVCCLTTVGGTATIPLVEDWAQIV